MVSGTPYRISFTSDNLVVTRQANCLQRAFGRDYSAQIAKNLQEEYSTYREVKSALNGLEEIVPLATEVLLYGKSDLRSTAKMGLSKYRPDLSIYQIEDYTERARIGGRVIGTASKIIDGIQKIKSNSIDSEIITVPLSKSAKAIDHEQYKRWKEFLTTNSDKISVLEHLKQIVDTAEEAKSGSPVELDAKTTGWLGSARVKKDPERMIRSFIDKNVLPELRHLLKNADIMTVVVNIFMAATKSADPYGYLANEIKKLEAPREREEQAWIKAMQEGQSDPACPARDTLRVIDNVMTTAFWRQTSKLGLEFAAQEKIPVLFIWKDSAGRDLTSGNSPQKKLWWHDEYALDHKYKGEVTYSEMRHLDRMKEKGLKLDGIKVGSDFSIPLST
jgi:hypothetical protein